MKNRSRIAIVYSDAGSGHRSAAAALQKVLQNRNPNCQVRMISITDIFNHHRVFGRIVRAGITFYNWQLKRDRVYGLRQQINLSLLCNELVGPNGIQKIAGYWNSFPPDIVISVTPVYNPVLYGSAMQVNPNVKCITIPVTFEEVRSRYWFTPKVEQYYLNATDTLHKQAAEAGISDHYRFRISGLPVEESAYELPPPDRDAQLRTIGLNPEWPVGFLSFGAQGSHNVLDIVRALAKKHTRLNLIIMCGKNKKLFRQINALKLPFPIALYSYLPQTPLHFLHLSDFAISKPGAMTITESLITSTSLIAQKSKGMSYVQKINEEWLTNTCTGIVAKTPENIAAAVTEILNNPKYREQMADHNHKAIFQIAAMIEKIGKLNQKILKPYSHVAM
ncbi:MAG TPA: glycosyltransferase [Niastella sp.]|nr:glycosyltransferase [Niastella sp.]